MVELPAGFSWGAATSSFQIEGDREGRGETIWDAFCRLPGAIADGSNGDVACDHVSRHVEDVALLRGLGVDAYRFSIAWARVQPGGRGPLSQAGIGFYDRLVDALLAAGITPWATLYHWDLPAPLQLRGGWASRRTVDAFVDYATAVEEVLGDRVTRWATHNEPWCAAWLGHHMGEHAPGAQDQALASRVSHHLLLSHGRAVAALRAQRSDSAYGIVLNPMNFRTVDGAGPDARAAAAAGDAIFNRLWLEPLAGRGYPADVLDLLAPHLGGAVADGDLEEIAVPTDFLGVNYYTEQLLADADATAEPDAEAARLLPGGTLARSVLATSEVTSMGWPVVPDGLDRLLRRLQEEYPTLGPMYVTENGSAWEDPVATEDSKVVEDPQRVAYLESHLAALARARSAGVDVRGYFAWSLLDNFEWAHGYAKRFGLVSVDYDTQRRTPKRSYHVYAQHVAAGEPRVPMAG